MESIKLNKENYNKLVQDIKQLANTNKPLIISIDGNCCSGKTTLADKLAKSLKASVLPMDDFFLRMEQRTKARYSEPGGNVDRERVDKILGLYGNKKDICYAPFSCKTNTLSFLKRLDYNNILIVEGAYSCHPLLEKYYQYKIFLKVDSNKQLDRIAKRNGLEKLEDFKNKWIVYENTYFSTFDIESKANIVFDTTESNTNY